MQLIVIAAEHPTLGTVYRRHVDESAANAIDEYTLTTSIAAATTLDIAWRTSPDLRMRMGDRFLHRAMATSGSTDERMCGGLALVQAGSDQSHYEFYCWMHSASWRDVPAPVGLANPIYRP